MGDCSLSEHTVPLYAHCMRTYVSHSHSVLDTVWVCAAQAFFYQVKLETELDEPPATRLLRVSLADIIM
jgi:hypothetical protein